MIQAFTITLQPLVIGILKNERIYFDSSYRHRNTSDMSWETGTVSFGVGYNISTRFSLQFNVGTTWGDYQGDQAVLALISRF